MVPRHDVAVAARIQPGVAKIAELAAGRRHPNPEETPREAVDALAIADLAEHAGVLDDLDEIERAWTELAGKREDVPLRQLLALAQKAGITTLTIPDSAEKLKAAIGNDFQRTMRFQYMPQGSWPLPAIATMLARASSPTRRRRRRSSTRRSTAA